MSELREKENTRTWSILFCWRQISRFCKYCWTNVIVSLLLPRYVRTYCATCIYRHTFWLQRHHILPGRAGVLTKERLAGTTTGFLWAGCPSCHSTWKHYRKTQWLGRLLFYIRNEFNNICCFKALFQLHPSKRTDLSPVFTTRVDGRLVSITHQHGPYWRVMEISHPLTRVVETGLY